MIEETEFYITQFYQVKTAPAQIDAVLNRVQYNPESLKDELSTLMHRLYDAILSNTEVTLAVMQYLMLTEHDDRGGGDRSYISEQYDKGESFSFLDLLKQHAAIFASEDRATLSHQDDDEFLEPLASAFKVVPTGFTVAEHGHERKTSSER